MHQFEFILKDFVNWKMDNIEVLEKFKEHGSMIYDRLEPVYAVLDYIYQKAVHHGPLNEDLQTIFQVGLNYLHGQFEVIRIYYENLFEGNCYDFENYAVLVGYLMFISDFRADLEDYEDSIDFEALNDVETTIEDMIAQRENNYVYAGEILNEATQEIVDQLDFEYVSIIDIFVEIAHNLGVAIHNEEMSIIGKDI